MLQVSLILLVVQKDGFMKIPETNSYCNVAILSLILIYLFVSISLHIFVIYLLFVIVVKILFKVGSIIYIFTITNYLVWLNKQKKT